MESDQRAQFLRAMQLPEDTTEKELTVILHSNVGHVLPFKSAVYPALLRLQMVDQGMSEHEARAFLAKKFPSIPAPDYTPKTQAQASAELRASLVKLYELPANASDADIAAAASAEKNANLQNAAARLQEQSDEVVIQQKIKKGLTREQAVNSLERQRKHDAALHEAQAKLRPRLLEIIQHCKGDLREARRIARDELGIMEGSEFQAAAAEYRESEAPAE